MPWKSAYPLRDLNSFGIEEDAQWFRAIHQEEEVKEILDQAPMDALHILGGGSNVLLSGPQKGWMIHNQLKGINVIRDQGDFVWVEVASGEVWDDWVQYALMQNWSGVENLSLIPGTVGAAPMQNIGAYGVEVCEMIEEIRAWDFHAQEEVRIPANQCGFGYRDSRFKQDWKGRFFLLSVTFRLDKKPKIRGQYAALNQALLTEGIENPDIHDISRLVRQIRTNKLPDPSKLGNAGSFFKNPVIPKAQGVALQSQHPELPLYEVDLASVKLPAAWLIEKMGWKGYREGCFGVHDRQALVLVNYGGAKGEEILNLSQRIMDSIASAFGVYLQREVQVWTSSCQAKGSRM